jgi:ribosome-associated protein
VTAPLIVDGVVLPPADLEWNAVRASGPGGQNVNKVASKVVLRFDLARSRALDDRTRARLRAIAGTRVDKDGVLTITSQKTRDQQRNLEDAREKLAALVRRALVREATRRPTKPSGSSKRRRLDDKKRLSRKKADRRADE